MEEQTPHPFRRYIPVIVLIATIVGFLLIAPGTSLDRLIAASPTFSNETNETTAATEIRTITPSPQPPTSASTPGALQVLNYDFSRGMLILSLRDSSHKHLFLYQPEYLPLTRITNGQWDDIHPAISPDGSEIAFSSNREGSWNLYSLNLQLGTLRQITDDPGYEASPGWSPDGQFIVYESLVNGDLEIFITRSDGSEDPIQLTDTPGPDHSPTWSPAGRTIAYVSNQTGDAEIWLANLQETEERFVNLSSRPDAEDKNPSWSPDGTTLTWASIEEGLHNILAKEPQSASLPEVIGSGDWPVFSPDNSTILSALDGPNNQYIAAYPARQAGLIAVPPIVMPGSIHGLDWGDIQLANPLPDNFTAAAASTPQPLWSPVVQSTTSAPSGRANLVPLEDVNAPDPRLVDDVNDSFEALRTFSAGALGWDLLATLDNAYVSITSPLPPGLTNNWLYTGRAFAITSSPVQAGWIVMVREDFGAQTYWRMFVRARFQDGSQGSPLTTLPFDLSARFSGDPLIYEQGGKRMDLVPEGYWVDFTDIAQLFGWERQPAQLNWRTFYQGARFNEFILTDGLGYQEAMLNMYPVEALITPSPITPVTPTATPSRTPTPTQTSTPTATQSPTASDSP